MALRPNPGRSLFPVPRRASCPLCGTGTKNGDPMTSSRWTPTESCLRRERREQEGKKKINAFAYSGAANARSPFRPLPLP